MFLMSDDAGLRKVALVLVHGIGVQDRYQFLSSFTDGLVSCGTEPGFCPDGQGDEVLGQFVPLVATDGVNRVEVHAHEVFWGPLLNGLTDPLSVLKWAVMTLWSSIPGNRRARWRLQKCHDEEARRVTTGWGKWLYESAYLGALSALIAFALYYFASATLLASDQVEYFNKVDAGAKDTRAAREVIRLIPWVPYDPSKHPDRFTSYQRIQEYTHFWLSSSDYLFTRSPKAATLDFQSAFSTDSIVRNISNWPLYVAVGYVISLSSLCFYFGRWIRFTFKKRKKQDSDDEQIIDENRKLALVWAMFSLLASAGLASHVNVPVACLLMALVLLQALYRIVKSGLSDVMGDVEIYVVRNENSKKFAGRAKVLCLTVDSIKRICADPQYDAVVVAAHSLGSVITLEAIRKLYTSYAAQDEDAGAFPKIASFVTFGSPLEKTRLFFAKKDYKSRYSEFSQEVDNRMFSCYRSSGGKHCIQWTNFWMWDDIVSDPLTSYPIRFENEFRMNPDRTKPKLWPHSDYWMERPFVVELAKVVVDAPNLIK